MHDYEAGNVQNGNMYMVAGHIYSVLSAIVHLVAAVEYHYGCGTSILGLSTCKCVVYVACVVWQLW